jgi:hypothetical protein
MKNKLLGLLLLMSCFSCKKSSHASFYFGGTVVPYTPVPITKSITKRVFAHLLPWFETPQSNTLNPGGWGDHWTMENENPNTIVNGQRQIASWYYPSIGPYASGDTAVIDYQLLLMKLSGIDGVFIDWPGTGTDAGQGTDLPMAKHNTDVIVSRLAKVGLKYAIVYEDNDLASISNKIGQAQTDMNYLQSNYFNDVDYEQISSKPLLLDFGPQAVTDTASWSSIFSILSPKPAFFTLSSHSQLAGANATGEFVWVYPNALSSLNSFYSSSYNPGPGLEKMSAAFSGFYSFYAAGGGSGPGPLLSNTPAPTVSFFKQTLDLAIQQTNNNYIQLVTWNDYGEGTIIEPTVQFGYGYLTTLQQDLGVQSTLSQSDLQAVAQLYQLRQTNAGNPAALAKLDQGFYFMASLQMDSAKALLASF